MRLYCPCSSLLALGDGSSNTALSWRFLSCSAVTGFELRAVFCGDGCGITYAFFDSSSAGEVALASVPICSGISDSVLVMMLVGTETVGTSAPLYWTVASSETMGLSAFAEALTVKVGTEVGVVVAMVVDVILVMNLIERLDRDVAMAVAIIVKVGV
jgi:hypothetical protein